VRILYRLASEPKPVRAYVRQMALAGRRPKAVCGQLQATKQNANLTAGVVFMMVAGAGFELGYEPTHSMPS